ncbi:hypothetical protein DRO69_01120 [Candidatus Bathyarchaeota archaeon]|nr:MAG: hypothetical protein DRO69_01120 [Candidatus Bathyarchaeota archaeon]
MKIIKHKKGQFIIFATLIIAIMIISIGAIMYSTVTYFKHERWQEYLMVIDNIELGSRRVVELSLANYTMLNGTNNQTLINNLNNWQINLTKAYPGFGVALKYSVANNSYSAYGLNINYSLGLASLWYNETSFSAANATFNLNITSAGLTGYKFLVSTLLKVRIFNATWSNANKDLTVYLAVYEENLIPIVNLDESNFSIKDVNNNTIPISSSNRVYDLNYGPIYRLYCADVTSNPLSAQVTVVDARNIKVITNSTVTQS